VDAGRGAVSNPYPGVFMTLIALSRVEVLNILRSNRHLSLSVCRILRAVDAGRGAVGRVFLLVYMSLRLVEM
jgi:hypothetical protein